MGWVFSALNHAPRSFSESVHLFVDLRPFHIDSAIDDAHVFVVLEGFKKPPISGSFLLGFGGTEKREEKHKQLLFWPALKVAQTQQHGKAAHFCLHEHVDEIQKRLA